MRRSGNASNEQSRQTALDWYLRNQTREEIDDATVSQWNDWWDKRENQAEYAEIVQLGEQAEALPFPSRPSDEDLRKDILREMALLPGRASLEVRAGRLQARQRPFLRSGRAAIVAACLGLLVCVIGLSVFFRFWPADPGRTYATAPGEQRDFTLEDGSSITLGGDTSINVRFTGSGRMLVLSRGEGMFHVRHDTDRPFSVCAASGCITAVGTVFDVRLYSNHVRVWVQQGAVDVSPLEVMPGSHGDVTASTTRWAPVRLAHGQEVSYDARNGASTTKAADPLNAGAWTNGSLIYFGRPLGEVVEDVQRYSSRRIAIDPDAALRLYSGSVAQQHIDQWIRGLAQIFPVEVTDCRVLQESNGSETDKVSSTCTSDPDRILIRSLETAP